MLAGWASPCRANLLPGNDGPVLGAGTTAGATALAIAAVTIVAPLACVLAYRGARRRRRFETQLIASESSFRLLVDNAKEYAIFQLDAQGRIQTWNAGAQRIKRYRADEIIGRHLSCLYPGGAADQDKVTAELAAALAKGQFAADDWRLRGDQTQFWASVVIAPLFDARGAHIGFSKITRDLTQCKQAQEQLIASESSFRMLVENALEYAIFQLDVGGRIKTWNAGAQRIKGYKADEVVGKHLSSLYPGGAADYEKVMAELVTALEEGQFKVDDWRVRKDQSRFWASIVITPMFDPSGAHVGFSKITRDLSERRRIEESLAEASRALQRRNLELEALNKELESFSYSVSHDLRAPLRSLDGFSHVLLEDYADKLDAQGQDILRRICSASVRMGQLIDDLINLSRVTRVAMSCETVDVSEMAREVAREMRESEPAQQVEFVVADNLVATTDANLLRIILTNLLSNAWKFTSKRSGAHIELGCSRENGTDTYFVRDNGAGFDMRYANQLFGAFQRLHRATEFAGTGIGLATVLRIVRRHGGNAWAEGRLGEGATFYFTLQPPTLRAAA
jgi:PAS domain S-box-containing protein